MSDADLPEFIPAQLDEMEAEAAVDMLIQHAAEMEASDLFLLTDQEAVSICMRRLGMMVPIAEISRSRGRHFISHIKAMAGMDVSDHRRPADGRWLFTRATKRLDLRISSVATLFGEDMTLRLWDRDAGLRTLDQLGLAPQDLRKLKSLLARPSGLILVTGPTGTGKTTTLYACLDYLNDGQRKINTLEDPVEYALDGVRQSQIFPKIGVDFAELLRNVLRQAPDVIMIGEVRDEETVDAAIRAANSGHLVLATLHAPVASAAVQSMLALGSHPFFLSSCLLGVIAQRLVRTLCPQCRMKFDISGVTQTFAPVMDLLDDGEGQAIYGPGNCEQCQNVGYAGRTGLFEIMTLNSELRRLLADARPTDEIEQAAIRHGMIEFRRGALLKVAKGVTSTEELLRSVPAEYLGVDD
jgi:type II secretory ATPase GspE/PulE/Tfp pilus assembly ATPase PilB-like protein